MPELSIIIVNYNTFSLTRKCLESIFLYPPKVSFEVILVDNGSSDEDAEKFLEFFSNIKLIKSNENLGFARGNNLGVSISTGQYLLLLNSDTELKMEGLEKCVNYLKMHPKCGALSCRCEYPEGKVQHVANRFPSIKYELVELFRLQKLNAGGDWLLGSFFDHESEIEVDWVWGTFFMVKREVLNKFKNKMLPAPYFMYFEDVLWCYLIKKLGYKVSYYPDYTIVHHLSKSSDFEVNKLKKITVVAKHENDFLRKEKGIVYSRILYFLRALKFLLSKTPSSKLMARFYFKLLMER